MLKDKTILGLPDFAWRANQKRQFWIVRACMWCIVGACTMQYYSCIISWWDQYLKILPVSSSVCETMFL